MATSLQELCRLVVQDTLGDLCAEIFSLLSRVGRSTRSRLQQLSGLSVRQIKTALACMTQLHVLLHQTTDDDVTYYHINWRHTYALLRSSRTICLVEDRYGQIAGTITAYLLQLGHARIQDLVGLFDLNTENDQNGYDAASRNGGSSFVGNGAEIKSQVASLGQLHATLRKLLRAGILAKVDKSAYMPAADLQAEIEELVIIDEFPDRKINGPKKQGEFHKAVSSMKRRRREAEAFSEQRDLSVSHAAGINMKRHKLNNGLSKRNDDGHEATGALLKDDLVVRVNHDQCTFTLRTQCLEELAEQYLGHTTASVYGALLQVLESKMRAHDGYTLLSEDSDEDDKDYQPIVSTVEVADVLDTTLNLNTFVTTDESRRLVNGSNRNKKRKPQSAEDAEDYALLGIKQEPSDSEEDHGANGMYGQFGRGARLDLIEEHLKLLAEHQLKFCGRAGAAGRGEWQVDFAALTKRLVQKNIDATIMSRLGGVHMRVVRMLRDKGRIDEKQIAAMSMMRLKDVRSVLTQLQYAGFVESQDVPKDAQRQPSRTIFLYFYDQNRVQDQLLQRTYQALSRILQRLQLERQRYASAIEKAEKMDVNQDALNQNEREAVMQWRAVEEKLLLQVDRLDEQVALLRDFSGRNSSLVS